MVLVCVAAVWCRCPIRSRVYVPIRCMARGGAQARAEVRVRVKATDHVLSLPHQGASNGSRSRNLSRRGTWKLTRSTWIRGNDIPTRGGIFFAPLSEQRRRRGKSAALGEGRVEARLLLAVVGSAAQEGNSTRWLRTAMNAHWRRCVWCGRHWNGVRRRRQ